MFHSPEPVNKQSKKLSINHLHIEGQINEQEEGSSSSSYTKSKEVQILMSHSALPDSDEIYRSPTFPNQSADEGPNERKGVIEFSPSGKVLKFELSEASKSTFGKVDDEIGAHLKHNPRKQSEEIFMIARVHKQESEHASLRRVGQSGSMQQKPSEVSIVSSN